MEQIRTVGGRSLSRCISFISDRFVAEAKCDKSGKITTTVVALPTLLVILLQKNYPIPRILRMLAFIFGLMSPRGRFLSALYIASLFLVQVFAEPPDTTVPQNDLSLWITAAFVATIFIAAFFLIRRFVAPWHGAEHMTIAAFYRSGLDLETIENESPVHPKCGGRLVLPILLISVLSFFISRKLEMHSLIFLMLLYEAILWIDAMIGFDKITPFAQASALLQRHVTSKRPGTIEILTGQAALLELIDAHRRNGALRETSRHHANHPGVNPLVRRKPWQSRS